MGDAKKMLDSSANLRLDKYAKMLNIMQKKKKRWTCSPPMFPLALHAAALSYSWDWPPQATL